MKTCIPVATAFFDSVKSMFQSYRKVSCRRFNSCNYCYTAGFVNPHLVEKEMKREKLQVLKIIGHAWACRISSYIQTERSEVSPVTLSTLPVRLSPKERESQREAVI